MLNHFAAVMVCGSTNGAPDAGVLPKLVSISLHIEKRSAAFAADCLDRRPVAIEAAAVQHDDQIPPGVGVSGLVPEFDPTPANNLVNNYLEYQPTPNVIAAVSVENLLNVDYTKYICRSTAAGHVVPGPGITFKGSLTVRYGVKGDS